MDSTFPQRFHDESCVEVDRLEKLTPATSGLKRGWTALGRVILANLCRSKECSAYGTVTAFRIADETKLFPSVHLPESRLTTSRRDNGFKVLGKYANW